MRQLFSKNDKVSFRFIIQNRTRGGRCNEIPIMHFIRAQSHKNSNSRTLLRLINDFCFVFNETKTRRPLRLCRLWVFFWFCLCDSDRVFFVGTLAIFLLSMKKNRIFDWLCKWVSYAFILWTKKETFWFSFWNFEKCRTSTFTLLVLRIFQWVNVNGPKRALKVLQSRRKHSDRNLRSVYTTFLTIRNGNWK